MALYGCDCYAYGLLAAGFTDLVIEATMQPYDYLALVPVVEGAGGVITDWTVNHASPAPHQNGCPSCGIVTLWEQQLREWIALLQAGCLWVHSDSTQCSPAENSACNHVRDDLTYELQGMLLLMNQLGIRSNTAWPQDGSST